LSLTPTEKPPYGFTVAAGNLVIRLGYKMQNAGVLLFAYTQIGDAAPQPWRQFLAPPGAAVEAAMALAADAEDYAVSTGHPIRPNEDLDLDDFIEHLSLNVTGEMH
jgi:hypothetical protein